MKALKRRVLKSNHWYRNTDMQMLTMMNSKKRTLQEFDEIFAAADPRFKLANVHMSSGSPLAIMEVHFQETAENQS